MAVCQHENFTVNAEVNRLTDEPPAIRVKAFTMDLTVTCKDCGLVFEFVGLPGGFSVYQPSCNVTGRTAHLPIMPPGQPPDPGMPGYSIRVTSDSTSSLEVQ